MCGFAADSAVRLASPQRATYSLRLCRRWISII
jgi:hypothetical protein